MYAIIEKNTKQWVSEACAGITEFKPGDTNLTKYWASAAIFQDCDAANCMMEKIAARMSNKSFQIKWITVQK